MTRIIYLAAFAFCSLMGATTHAQQQPPGQAPGNPQQAAQAPPGPVKVDATVKSVEVKGRVRKMTVTSPTGEDLEITITPKIQFEVHGVGDSGFIRPGQMFESQGVMTNKRLFVSNVNVYLLPKGRKPTPGKMVKAPRVAGQSTETYQISGPIVAVQQDSDFPEYTAIAVRTNGPGAAVLLEKNYQINVISDDIESVTEGTPVEVEGLPGPGGRFIVGRVVVKLVDPLKADELLGPLEAPEKK